MTLLSQTNTIRVMLNVLALPSFIMAVNGFFYFEVHKSAYVIIKVHLSIIKVNLSIIKVHLLIIKVHLS